VCLTESSGECLPHHKFYVRASKESLYATVICRAGITCNMDGKKETDEDLLFDCSAITQAITRAPLVNALKCLPTSYTSENLLLYDEMSQ